MSRCQQYIASVHISCQISYHHDYRHPRHNVVERLDTYWFMICCQKCLIWHHHICWWYVRIYGTYWTRICWLYLVKGPWYGVTTICWWYAHIYMIHIRHVSVDDCLSKAPNMGVTAICSSLHNLHQNDYNPVIILIIVTSILQIYYHFSHMFKTKSNISYVCMHLIFSSIPIQLLTTIKECSNTSSGADQQLRLHVRPRLWPKRISVNYFIWFLVVFN